MGKLTDEELHLLYRLCTCGRWVRRLDEEAWRLHRELFCPTNANAEAPD